MAAVAELVVRIRGDTAQLSGALGKTESAFSRFGTAIKRGALVAGAALVGLGAAAVKSAVTMNSELETATLQFETLMGSADQAKEHVAKLFDFAKKTPFETGPIIEASRMLQTFGGAALNTMDNLKLIGDAAAATSAPINELGFWVGRLFSQLQAGKPFGEAAMRLQELAVLSPKARDEMEKLQEAGASTDEVWKVFTDDMLRFNGAMIKQASTWKGLTSTMKDAVGLAIAQALRPLFEAAKDTLGALVDLTDTAAWDRFIERAQGALRRGLDPFVKRVKEFAEALKGGQSFQQALETAFGKISFEKVVDKLSTKAQDLGESILGLIVKALDAIPEEELAEAMTFIAITLTKALIAGMVALAPAVGRAIGGAIKGMLLGAGRAVAQDPAGTLGLVFGALLAPAVVTKVFASLLSKIPIAKIFMPWLLLKLSALGGPIRSFIAGRLSLWLVQGVATGFGAKAVLGAIGNAVAGLGSAIMGALTGAISGPAIAAVLGAALGVGLHLGIERFLPQVNRALESFGGMLFTFFAETIPGAFRTAWRALETFGGQLFTFFTETIPRAAGGVVSFFASLPGRIGGAFGTVVGVLRGIGAQAMSGLASAVSSAAGAVLGFFVSLPGRAGAAIGPIIGRLGAIGRQAISALGSGAQAAFGAVINFVRSIPGRIAGAFGNTGFLFRIGRAIISGLINGLLSRIGDLISAARRLGQIIRDHKGPISADRMLLFPAGEAIMEGLQRGMASALPSLQSFLGDVTGSIAMPAPAAAMGGGGVVNVNVAGSVITERDLVDIVHRELLRFGLRNVSTGIR